MRKYRSGTRWTFWRWTRLSFRGESYMDRLHLVQTPWFSVMLHWFRGPDPHPDPHDHPVSFLSLVLRGWYREFRYRRSACPTPRLERGLALHENKLVRWVNLVPADGIHRIVAVKPGTVTLVLAGPVVRRWGYYAPGGWVDWKDYGAGK